MATKNQMVVAEALRLARTNFHEGLTFLSRNFPKLGLNPKDTFRWFAAKCLEHGIVAQAEFDTAMGAIK